MTYNGHYRRNQTAPEFLREIVWCGFRAPGNVFILCYLQAGIDFKLIHPLMNKPFQPPIKLEGMPISVFHEHLSKGDIQARKARLIPTYKVGDELALASIFLACVRMVKEFREKIFSDIKFGKAGQQYYFTEVVFFS